MISDLSGKGKFQIVNDVSFQVGLEIALVLNLKQKLDTWVYVMTFLGQKGWSQDPSGDIKGSVDTYRQNILMHVFKMWYKYYKYYKYFKYNI